MKQHLFAFIDTETTGFDPDRHELIEIGGLVVDASKGKSGEYVVLDEFEYKIKPERIGDADPAALRVNNYDPSAWGDALPLKEVMQRVAEKTKSMNMVAHNVAFDSAFIEKAFKISGVKNEMHYHKLDTVSMAYAVLRNVDAVDHFSLHALCEYFGIKNERAHSALSDARAMFELYKKLMSL